MAFSAMSPEDPEEKVCRVVRAIPPGQVATYGEVAREAGLGRRARFVGRVMAQLPEGSDVPWHRVLRAGGELAFPAGSEHHQRQRARLEAEGVTFRGRRVDLTRHGRPMTLDELLWGGGGHC